MYIGNFSEIYEQLSSILYTIPDFQIVVKFNWKQNVSHMNVREF